jgi:Neuraminidase (sialidase)
MLDFLKEFSKDGYDAIFVLPGDTKDDLHIEGATYKEPGEKVGGNAIGDEYHVILFKEQEDGELYNVDKFEAIFADNRGDVFTAQGKKAEALGAYQNALGKLDAADKSLKSRKSAQQEQTSAVYRELLRQKICIGHNLTVVIQGIISITCCD